MTVAAGGINQASNAAPEHEAEIKQGSYVKLKSGNEIQCHQLGNYKGRAAIVDEAPPMPQNTHFKGRVLDEEGKYTQEKPFEFCKGCIAGVILSDHFN